MTRVGQGARSPQSDGRHGSLVRSGRPPRVLHVIDSLRVGGAERLLAALVSELARSGGSVNFVCASSAATASERLVADIRSHAEALWLVDGKRSYDPTFGRAIVQAARRFRVDVVHSHLAVANVHSRGAAWLLRKPHVTTIHTAPGSTAEDPRRRVIIDGLTARLSARLVAPSRETADAYARAFWLARDRVQVVPNAPAGRAPQFGFDAARVRGQLVGSETADLVLCVARLQPQKGIDDLVTAAELLRRRLPTLRVVVAGGGPDEARLRATIVERQLDGVVHLLGFRSDVDELLAAADVFCLPSRHEGLPVSLLEAMAAGLPCVSTAVGGVPTLIDDERTGLLVAPNEPAMLAGALERALIDRALAARLGRAAKRHVAARHSIEAVARRYAGLYAELMAQEGT